ncbi:MAG TPA: phasin family protein [Pseudolabrys sp.]
MVDKSIRAEASKTETAAKALADDVMEMGQKRMEAMMEAQKQIAACCEQTLRGWNDRMKLEFDLASDLTTKLGASKSIPESMQIYQEWLGRRMKLFAEQGQEIMSDFQNLLSASTRSMSGTGNGKR